MVDIQSATAKNRRGRNKKPQDKNNYNARICYAGRP